MTDSNITYVFLAVIVAAVVATIGFLMLRRPRVQFTELGAMSEQWLAEQRANDRPY